MRLPRVWIVFGLVAATVAVVALVIAGHHWRRLGRSYTLKAQGFRKWESVYRETYQNEMLNIHALVEDATSSREKAKSTAKHSPAGMRTGGTVEGFLSWASVCEASAAQHSLSARADRARLDYLEAMRKKYENAADHPWLPVSPDPPPPYPRSASDPQ